MFYEVQFFQRYRTCSLLQQNRAARHDLIDAGTRRVDHSGLFEASLSPCDSISKDRSLPGGLELGAFLFRQVEKVGENRGSLLARVFGTIAQVLQKGTHQSLVIRYGHLSTAKGRGSLSLAGLPRPQCKFGAQSVQIKIRTLRRFFRSPVNPTPVRVKDARVLKLLGRRARQLREERGLSQEEMSRFGF